MASGPQPQVLQVVFVGDSAVGKTSLVRRFLGHEFDEDCIPSTQSTWYQKLWTAYGSTYTLQIRDVPGRDPWMEGIRALAGTAVAVVYSCTSAESFAHAGSFLQRLLTQPSQKCVLIAAKCDELYQRVPASAGLDFARSQGVPFLQTSAKSLLNVAECFSALCECVSREPTTAVTDSLEFSQEEIRQALGLVMEIDTMQARSYSTYSPQLVLSPDSPDTIGEEEQPEEIALVEESDEGRSTLGLVYLDVQTCEIATQTDNHSSIKRGRPRLSNAKKKKEELDKFWLRQFRRYMKKAYAHLKTEMTQEERNYWKKYLSPELKPDKTHQFKSYNKDYKAYLFRVPHFSCRFQSWFHEKGEELLAQKFDRGSEGFSTFYDYAATELLGIQHTPDELVMEY